MPPRANGARELAEHVIDQLELPVDLRRFFGGWALVLDHVQFAMVMDTVYLVTDESSRPELIHAGSVPFTYQAKGKTVTVSRYYSVPPDALDDPQRLRQLVATAIATAHAR